MSETTTHSPLDPDAQLVADRFAVALPAGLSGLGVQGVRTFSKQSDAGTPVPAEVQSVTEHNAAGPHGDVRIRLYRPDCADPLPVLLYLHGGGWTMGSIDGGADHLVRDIVTALDMAVVSVDYRLAPENKFPIPLEDCLAALRWVRANGQTLGLDTAAVAIAGDSAGANIAASITHLDRDAEHPLLAQILMCPATEYAVERPSWIDHADAPVLTAADTVWFWDQYLRTADDRTDPRATPANAESFSDLPPALVVVAGHDPLRDDGLHYGALLESAGVAVEIERYDGSFHDFVVMPALSAYTANLDTLTRFLRTNVIERGNG
ncbi:alpha/beta hydrolase [Nocardia fusca]|uniref:alpha/beta hydrolase n=1 Tax=Nocardia fusca TaxID=941183 RepID=UPI0037AE59E9